MKKDSNMFQVTAAFCNVGIKDATGVTTDKPSRERVYKELFKRAAETARKISSRTDGKDIVKSLLNTFSSNETVQTWNRFVDALAELNSVMIRSASENSLS